MGSTMLASNTVFLCCISTALVLIVAGETSFRVSSSQLKQLPKRVFCNFDGCYSKRMSSSPSSATGSHHQWLELRRRALALPPVNDQQPSGSLRPNTLSSSTVVDESEDKGSLSLDESNDSERTKNEDRLIGLLRDSLGM